MLLKSIKLHNIRSYEDHEINFPIGSLLLAGDIGSGKSTILLAIEFAIFGAKKGELPAHTLLRHGKKDAHVQLIMQIDNKDVIVKRALKRGNDGIKQESGYVVINGIKKEGTAEELRAWLLDLLGYPKDLVKKGKDLIYRYTVYTPQEEMKQILYENKENRLETLRKVFNIDKYKRVKENSKIILASLKEKKNYLEGSILDLEYKKRDSEEKKNETLNIDKRIKELNLKIDEVKNILTEKRKSIENIENDIKQLISLRKELSVTEANLNHRIEQNNKLNDEINRLSSQIEELEKVLENRNLEGVDVILKKIDTKEKEINEVEYNYKSNIKKIKELEVKIEHCSDTIRKIRDLEICPVCEQNVDEAHKHNVNLRENKKYEELVNQIKDYKGQESRLEEIKIILKKELDSLIKEEKNFNILRIKFENLNEKINDRKEKLNLKDAIKKAISSFNTKKIELSSKINNYAEIEDKYKIVRKEIDNLLPEERFLELEKRKHETEKESIKRFIVNLEREIDEKQKAKERLAYISQFNNWISELFLNLMSSMEKHVMINIHSHFDELFKNWFSMLLEDETINVRVDEDFTPIIEQDGYDTFIENLSGGEKTAVALSYRLSLNKVINDVVATIKTKDIIMLDEPTDGFSTEQLDKVRDILEQLNVKQIIIVSHESKIESFVENVIRVQKQDSISTIV